MVVFGRLISTLLRYTRQDEVTQVVTVFAYWRF